MDDGSPMQQQQQHNISDEDAAIYDRQIRLWGLEAQTRIRDASVLVLGFNGLACEAVKNMVLAGVGSVTLVDDTLLSEADLGCNFFVSSTDVGANRADASKPRIQQLNPRVQVECIRLSARLVTREHIAAHQLVILTRHLDPSDVSSINRLCRERFPSPAGFLYAATPSLSGYIFADLGQHIYTEELPGSVIKQRMQEYVPFEQAVLSPQEHTKNDGNAALLTGRRLNTQLRAVRGLLIAKHLLSGSNDAEEAVTGELVHRGLLPSNYTEEQRQQVMEQLQLTPDDMRLLIDNAHCELSFVCAVVGGVLAQEAVKYLSGRGACLANLFVFDGLGMRGGGPVYALGISAPGDVGGNNSSGDDKEDAPQADVID
ncbi:E1 ubiquitin-activating protein aos1 [Sorochytrium milnesiophthora]